MYESSTWEYIEAPEYPLTYLFLGPRLVVIGSIISIFLLVMFLGWVTSGITDSNPQGDTGGNPAPGNAVSQTLGGCEVSSLFPAQVLQWCTLVTQHSRQNGIEPDLIAALILVESGGDHLAYSKSGAVGLMQVMPRDGLAANFVCRNGPCFSDRPTIIELQDPTFNISYGVGFLAGLINRHGNLRDALYAYGPMDVGYSYADQVLGLYQQYQE